VCVGAAAHGECHDYGYMYIAAVGIFWETGCLALDGMRGGKECDGVFASVLPVRILEHSGARLERRRAHGCPGAGRAGQVSQLEYSNEGEPVSQLSFVSALYQSCIMWCITTREVDPCIRVVYESYQS
jgi:hypothetical protein